MAPKAREDSKTRESSVKLIPAVKEKLGIKDRPRDDAPVTKKPSDKLNEQTRPALPHTTIPAEYGINTAAMYFEMRDRQTNIDIAETECLSIGYSIPTVQGADPEQIHQRLPAAIVWAELANRGEPTGNLPWGEAGCPVWNNNLFKDFDFDGHSKYIKDSAAVQTLVTQWLTYGELETWIQMKKYPQLNKDVTEMVNNAPRAKADIDVFRARVFPLGQDTESELTELFTQRKMAVKMVAFASVSTQLQLFNLLHENGAELYAGRKAVVMFKFHVRRNEQCLWIGYEKTGGSKLDRGAQLLLRPGLYEFRERECGRAPYHAIDADGSAYGFTLHTVSLQFMRPLS
jgi:hypothetical protein